MSYKLTVYCLSVTIETDNHAFQKHIDNFLRKYYTLTQSSFSATSTAEPKLFAGKIKHRGVYQLHSNQFIHLYHYLKDINYSMELSEKIDKRDYKVESTDFRVRDNWKLRDYQVPVYEFLLDNPVKSKLVPLQTGLGKTAIFLYTAATIRQRLAIVILPTYIDKWVSDVASIHDAKTSDVMVIQGSKALRSIVELAKHNSLTNDYYIFSNRTLQEFITQYEENPEQCVDFYGISPIELFPLLGIGVLLVDETHQHFHSIFKILLYSNVKFQVGLSATLLSEESVIRRLHSVVYPSNCIYTKSSINRYIDVYAITYNIAEHYRKHLRTTNYGSKHYSHVAFEQSITKRQHTLDKYLKLIDTTIKDYYIQEYVDKDKLLIFVATVNLATQLTEYLKEIYTDKVVNRYCENDPYTNLQTSDIIVSTVISSGTAVDIENLRVVIQTVAISSTVSNIQSLGRLRDLKNRDVKFCYLYTNTVAKQKEYHLKRVEIFTNLTANITHRSSRAGIQ